MQRDALIRGVRPIRDKDNATEAKRGIQLWLKGKLQSIIVLLKRDQHTIKMHVLSRSFAGGK